MSLSEIRLVHQSPAEMRGSDYLLLEKATSQTTNHSSIPSASRVGAWKCHHNNRPVCETLRYFNDSMPRALNISHTFETPAFHLSSQL